MRFLRILSIALLLSISIIASANQYRFRTLSPEGGFYYDGVLSILEDSDGFIWILMENNIYRFDGYQYKNYYSRFTNVFPAKEWSFSNMTINSVGKLFVNTNNGLYAYDKISDAFYSIRESPVEKFMIDAHDTVWIKQNNQWGILDIENKSVFIPLFDGEKSPHYIGSVYCLNNDDLYLFSNYGRLYRFNNFLREFFYCMSLPSGGSYVIKAITHKGKLWVFKQGYGLCKIDLSTFMIEEYFDFYSEHPNTIVRDFYIDKKGEIWIGTIKGLYILNPETKKYSFYQHSELELYSIPNNSIWSINEDRQKNIWIGMYSGKICYVNLDEKNPFTTYFPGENGLNNVPVSAFIEDQHYLWVGTEGGGLNRINKSNGEYTYYTYTGKSGDLSSNNIKSMAIDKEKNIWIATYNGGLNCYNSGKQQFYHFFQNSEKNFLLSKNIKKIVLENDSGLWIVYQLKKSVISFYSFKDKTITHYDLFSGSGQKGITIFDKKNLTVKRNGDFYIFDILRGRKDQLWVLSREKIYLINLKDMTMSPIEREDTTFMNFSAFCLDNSGNLWIGTIGNGLVKYNPDVSCFTNYKEVLNHNISAVYSICNNDESIWMGTDNGLILYNITTDVFSRYDKQDGVQGPIYYPLASMRSLNGEMYFGGTSGFTVVNPKDISVNTYKSRIILSDFLIDNVPVDFPSVSGDSSEYAKEIVLNHNQTNFGIRFASDNYLIPEKNRFKYRLRGYDDRWIETDAFNRTALYSKVPSGVYYFEVMAANNDNIWSDNITVVKIRCRPAPWFSWPAYIFYTLIVLSVLYFILRYYNDKKKLKFQLHLENVEKNKKEEIHQTQLRFYTDISHDFKTPLSLILAALYKVKKGDRKDNYYDIMESNSRRLLNLVNELMDFKTVENGKMRLKLQETDINTFVKKIIMDFMEYAGERGIDLVIRTDQAIRSVYIDRNILEKIIMNLLNNAFKFTNKGGMVSVEIHADNHPFQSSYINHYVIQSDGYTPEDTFGIVIRDTGIGISKELMENVFERYYKIDMVNSDQQLGTGIGLALVKSFILLHKGKLSIFSEKDQGTDIEIRFSGNEYKYEASCFMYGEEILPEKNGTEGTDIILDDNDISKLMKSDRKRVLVVEDHNDLRKLITDTLSENYDVVEASDGVEASFILQNRLIHLIISDIMMPNKDGITFSMETKNNIKTSHIPIILLTAKTGIENKIEGVGAGADIYLEKPVDFNLLQLTIQNIFSQQQYLKEYYVKNYFSDNFELFSNEQDNIFLKNFIQIIYSNLNQSQLDVNFVASQMLMSRSKLYNKIKMMTGKSVIEFILNLRLRKAASLILEKNVTMRQVMEEVGIESQAYFTNAFKKEFGETPTSFAAKHKKNKEL